MFSSSCYLFKLHKNVFVYFILIFRIPRTRNRQEFFRRSGFIGIRRGNDIELTDGKSSRSQCGRPDDNVDPSMFEFRVTNERNDLLRMLKRIIKQDCIYENEFHN